MRYAIYGEDSPNHEVGFLLPNHLASSLDDATGDYAEHIVNTFGLPAIAFERTGTADLTRHGAFDADSYLEDARERAEILCGEIGKIGVDQVIICGKSAAALDALAIASTGILAVQRVIAMEPVAMLSLPRRVGLKRWYDGNRVPDKTEVNDPSFKALSPLEPIRKPASKELLARRMLKEIKAYMSIYISDVGVGLLESLANDHPEIPVDLYLADSSTATTPALVRDLPKKYEGSSIKVTVLPGATHAFPDPNEHFVHAVKMALETSQPTKAVDSSLNLSK